MSLRAAPIAREWCKGFIDCVKGSPVPSTPCALCAACVRVTRLSTTLRASPGYYRLPHFTANSCPLLAGHRCLVSSFSWPTASPLVTLRGCACCQLLFRAEPQVVFEGDVKGGPLVLSASFRVLLVRYPHAPAKVDTHVVWLVVACFPVFD
jgi:hypothetical protein